MEIRTHTLKVATQYMDAIKSGEKTFEVRKDDRGFQRGDLLDLCRYGNPSGSWGGAAFMDAKGDKVSGWSGSTEIDRVARKITYILTGGQFGIEPGFVVLGISEDTPNG